MKELHEIQVELKTHEEYIECIDLIGRNIPYYHNSTLMHLTETSHWEKGGTRIYFKDNKWKGFDRLSSNNNKNFKIYSFQEFKDTFFNDKPDMDALLEEAKRRYPVGTRYEVINQKGRIEEVDRELWIYDPHAIAGTIGGCFVYDNGKWAEIVSKPEQILEFPEEGHIVFGKANIDPNFRKHLDNLGKKFLTGNTLAYDNASIIAWSKKEYWYCNSSSKKEYKFEDLQHFLPIEKKEIEFKKGKWYKINYQYLGMYYVKFEGDISSMDNIKSGEFYTCGNFSLVKIDIMQEIDIKEIQQYLPDGHVDKITTKEQKTCVEITSQSEWDFITEELGYKWKENWFESDGKVNQYVILDEQSRFCRKENAIEGNYKILSFNEWLEENNLSDKWFKHCTKRMVSYMPTINSRLTSTSDDIKEDKKDDSFPIIRKGKIVF